jgi:hypothetical protein
MATSLKTKPKKKSKPRFVAAASFTNEAVWKDGKPVALKNVTRIETKAERIWTPTENDWKYSHHHSVATFKGRLYAIFSSSLRDEDTPGQRVMYAVRSAAGMWSKPRVLFQPTIDPDGKLRVLTAAGFHINGGTLVAYAGDYADNRKTTHLYARTSTDGELWDESRDLHLPVCPNHGPQKTSTGRLIIAGNTACPYTDDPSGLTGWKMAGLAIKSIKPFHDNPTTFWEVCKKMKWTNLCEASIHETDDGMLWMLLRATSLDKSAKSILWESRSTDDGETWSTPKPTTFSNTDAKFHFGRLPDGRYYCVGNPLATDAIRMPLVLSTSKDGIKFNRHYIIGDRPYVKRFEGAFKGGEYSYPHSLVHDGKVYVLTARQKESIELVVVPIAALKP